jgi:CheY-like chemotaxis protein
VASAVLVKVVGFSVAERNAFGSLLRLSAQRSPTYALWSLKYTRPATIAVVDGTSPEALSSLLDDHRSQVRALWVGANAPILAWRRFERPIEWIKILKGMDDAHAAAQDDTDPGLDSGIGAQLEADASRPFGAVPDSELPTLRKRLLVVDDDVTARLYLRAKLAVLKDTDIDEADNGNTALAMVRRHDYAGVLLDVNLPGQMNGYEICRAIKRMPQMPGAPRAKVVLITSRDGMIDRVRGTLCGADAYITKPPHPARLNALIATF